MIPARQPPVEGRAGIMPVPEHRLSEVPIYGPPDTQRLAWVARNCEMHAREQRPVKFQCPLAGLGKLPRVAGIREAWHNVVDTRARQGSRHEILPIGCSDQGLW
jgi:hypothetical protein